MCHMCRIEEIHFDCFAEVEGFIHKIFFVMYFNSSYLMKQPSVIFYLPMNVYLPFGVNANFGRIASGAGNQLRTGGPKLSPFATNCCGRHANHSAKPNQQKHIDTSRMVSYTGHNNDPIMGRNYYPQGFLYLVLALRNCYCKEEISKHVSHALAVG